MTNNFTERAGIYVHIPFCKRKCNYCDFKSIPYRERSEEYFNALKKEILNTDAVYKTIDTVYFGGGTPSFVDERYIVDVFNLLRNKFDFDLSEATIEANPESITKSKLLAYKSAGFDRLSIGVQSLSDDVLKFLGRVHDSDMAKSAVKTVLEFFDNVSCDIMLVGQSADSVEKDIDFLSSLGVKHISCYMLQIEEGTPFYDRYIKNEIKLPTDDELADLFSFAIAKLKSLGYERYEVSNFCKRGYEAKHNLGYWVRKPYYGFGLSAHSLIGNERYGNQSAFDEYVSDPLKREFKEVLSESDIELERIMLALRTSHGVLKEEILNKPDFYDKYKNYFYIKGDRISLNDKGFMIMNKILVDLLQ